MSAMTGRRIVDMVWEDLTPQKIISPQAVDNAIKVHMAMGGSTNAMVHLVAIARRAGINLTLDRFDELSREIPVIANVRPSGKYLMEDFFYAGGLRALMDQLKPNARSRLHDGERQDRRRKHRRRRNPSAGRDPHAQRSDLDRAGLRHSHRATSRRAAA